jgi:hypothetical protein
MSDDQLNDNLKSRIREVFDHYEDDTADESWLLLREKFPEEKDKDRAVVWLWRNVAAVALILAILNIGLWLNFHQQEKIIIITKNAKINNDSKTQLRSKKDSEADNTIIAKNVPGTSAFKTSITTASRLSINKTLNATQDANNGLPGVNNTDANNNNILTNGLVNKPKSTVTIDSALVPPTYAVVKNQKLNEQTAENKAQVSNSMQSLFDKEKTQPQLPKAANNITANSNGILALSVYEATYVNYAKGSNTQLNTGAGVTSDIRLSPNFSISTGISIAQNSLSYNNSSANASIPLFLAASHNFAPNTNMLDIEAPTSKTLNASLVGLDVPLNLKYVFNPQNRNTYISAGFSSGTFINETYNYSYSYASSNNSNSLGSQDEINHKSFDSFYFAQMLNLSFGVGYPLGKNSLIIEPFVKYPLDGLGDQHLLFGSGGLNLKFNFGGGKTKQ